MMAAGDGVAGVRGPRDVHGLQRARRDLGADAGQLRGIRTFGERIAGGAGDAGARAEPLEVAASSAGADGAVHVHGEVAELARDAVGAADQAAAADHGTTEAGRDGQVDQVVESGAGAEGTLGKDGHVRVALHDGGQGHRLGEAVGERQAPQVLAKVRRIDEHAALRIERTRRRDPDRRRHHAAGGDVLLHAAAE